MKSKIENYFKKLTNNIFDINTSGSNLTLEELEEKVGVKVDIEDNIWLTVYRVGETVNAIINKNDRYFGPIELCKYSEFNQDKFPEHVSKYILMTIELIKDKDASR